MKLIIICGGYAARRRRLRMLRKQRLQREAAGDYAHRHSAELNADIAAMEDRLHKLELDNHHGQHAGRIAQLRVALDRAKDHRRTH